MAKLDDETRAFMETAVCNREDACLKVYSGAFNSLWDQVTGDAVDPLPRNVFLVWDDIPSQKGGDDIGVRNYLTAYDWVMAMILAASKAFKDGMPMERFEFELRILPMAAPDAYKLSPAMRITPLLRKAILPWVTLDLLYDDAAFVGAMSGTDTPSGRTLADTFREPSLNGKKIADLIADLWRNELTKAGVRHSVSNAIGPAALAQSLVKNGFSAADSVLRDWLEGEDRLRLTFWRFLELLELLPALERREGGKAQLLLGGLSGEPFVKEDFFGQFKHLRFALVDDQAGAGFHDALGAFLLGEQGSPPDGDLLGAVAVSRSKAVDDYSLSSFSHPQILLDWLRHTLTPFPADKSHRPVFGRQNLYAEPTTLTASMREFDILFLDLRLHGISGNQHERDNEKTWTTELLKFVDSSLSGVITQYNLSLKQQRAFDIARDAARKRVEGRVEEEQIIAQLALLPILISICDPTMPIILFSSTQQKAVLGLLQPFPNIFTNFAKPTISGYSDQDANSLESVVLSLRQDLSDALILHEKRFLWDLIANFDFRDAVAPTCAVTLEWFNQSPRAFASGKNWYLINMSADRPEKLPLSKEDWYNRRLRDMILDYIRGDVSVDHIYRPYELFESALKPEALTNFNVRFDSDVFSQFVIGGDLAKIPHRTRALEAVKKARNKVVHENMRHVDIGDIAVEYDGNIVLIDVARFVVSYAGLINFLNFLYGIGSGALKRRMNILHRGVNLSIKGLIVTGREDPEPVAPMHDNHSLTDRVIKYTKALLK